MIPTCMSVILKFRVSSKSEQKWRSHSVCTSCVGGSLLIRSILVTECMFGCGHWEHSVYSIYVVCVCVCLVSKCMCVQPERICVRDSDPLLVFSMSQMGHGSWS